jgi:ribosomal protein L44E
MIKIGDHVRCPQCNEVGCVVWVSQDEKRAGIQCPGHHSQMSRGHSKFGSTARPQTKREKNMVFLIEIETVATLASTHR